MSKKILIFFRKSQEDRQKPAENVLPADFDNPGLYEEVDKYWRGE